MTQRPANLLAYVMPILVILPMLYFRAAPDDEAAAAETEPALGPARLILAWSGWCCGAGAAHPAGCAADWAWLGLAAVLGGVAGWHWGRTMAIHVHPEDGTLMARGGQAALIMMGLLIVVPASACAPGSGWKAQPWHLNMLP